MGDIIIREIRCRNCSRGCLVNVKHDDEKIIDVYGNNCGRGYAYVERIVKESLECNKGE